MVERGARFRRLRRGALAAALALAALYVGALAFSRTDAFRDLLARRFSSATGGELSLGRARLTPALALEFEAVSWREAGAAEAAIRADFAALRLAWPARPWHPRSLSARGGAAVFTQDADRRWQPRRLAALAESLDRLLNLGLPRPRGAPPALPPPDLSRPETAVCRLPVPPFAVRLENFDVVWRSAAGAELAQIEGLNLSATPEVGADRRLVRVRLTARRIERERGLALAHPQMEFELDGAERRLVHFSAGAPPPP